MIKQCKYYSTNTGFCRVYYKVGRTLLCWQEDSPNQFKLYECSRDGEPSHEVSTSGLNFERPQGITKIDFAVQEFLENL